MSIDHSGLLDRRLQESILILDGAMGTMIQKYNLDEAGYRGNRFADWEAEVKGKQVKPRRSSRSEERRVGKECRSRWSPYH